jgi:ATP-dependent helicase/nuclease subunit B
VAQICYIGLGSGGKLRAQPVAAGDLDEIMAGFTRLITHFGQEATGYPSRRAMQEVKYAGDFDHLARFGEWDETMPAEIVEVGR